MRSIAGARACAARIHILGVAYKAGVNDVRESPALNVMRILCDKGALLSYCDPYVPAIREDWLWFESLPLTNGYLWSVDCVVVLTAHRKFDYGNIAAIAPLVVDTRNTFRGREGAHIVRL